MHLDTTLSLLRVREIPHPEGRDDDESSARDEGQDAQFLVEFAIVGSHPPPEPSLENKYIFGARDSKNSLHAPRDETKMSPRKNAKNWTALAYSNLTVLLIRPSLLP